MIDDAAAARYALNSDSAVTLGLAGKRLRAALEAFEAFTGPATASERAFLLDSAADALWAYVIQKELLGVSDHEMLDKVFKVPKDVWRRMGILHKEEDARRHD